jgi:hypothetical protein
LRPNDIAWQAIFDKYNIYRHNFDDKPFLLKARQIKEATKHFDATGQREVRILCKQDSRESRPRVFQENGLFILPIKNGEYVIVKGEGYIDIPLIKECTKVYVSYLDFQLVTSTTGNSEMQHLDFAYATSLIRSFTGDESLVLTIRGRKYTPKFNFTVGNHAIEVKSVQTEVDAGYEGRNQVVLVEAKRSKATNTIIRQLYYPFRQWTHHLKKRGVIKPVYTIFFEKSGDEYFLWQFQFTQEENYNSIELVHSKKFKIEQKS